MEQIIKGQVSRASPCLLDREGPYFNQLCRRCGLRRSSGATERYHLCPKDEDLAGVGADAAAPITACN